MKTIYKCDDCGNDDNLGGLNLTCYGHVLCQECIIKFSMEMEKYEEQGHGGY